MSKAMFGRRWAEVLSIVVGLLMPALVPAQTFKGGVRGLVTDSTGAIIGGANVTLTNEGTNVALTTVSNSAGEYNFPALNPATYTLAVEKGGFKRETDTGIVIDTQSFVTVDVKLSVGALTQSVVVSASTAPLMQTVLPSAGAQLKYGDLTALPNLGRNSFITLEKVSPNVVPSSGFTQERFQDESTTSSVTVAGSPQSPSQSFMLDGLPITATDNRATAIPTIEGVGQEKLQFNTYDAEIGRTAGGVFNTFLKSGSNDYHAVAFGYIRPKNWAANDYFSNRAGLPLGDNHWKNWGFALGGPVMIPKLYNGKNRTFFWLSEEGYRQALGLTTVIAVPTAAERQGDFSHSLNQLGTLQTIYDPATTTTDALGNVTRTPFQGNVIPADRINNIAKNIVQYYRDPTQSTPYYGAPNYTASTANDNAGDTFVGKIDEVVTKWWSASASFLWLKTHEPSAHELNNLGTWDQAQLLRRTDNSTFSSTFIISPTMVMDIRYGYNRWPNEYPCISSGMNPSVLGFPASLTSQMQYFKFPEIDMQSLFPMGCDSETSYYVPSSKNLTGSLIKQAGTHSLKFGGMYRRMHRTDYDLGFASGDYSFDDTFTRANYQASNGNTGADLASLLLGTPTTGQMEISTKLNYAYPYYAGFVQDNWRLRTNLTLDLGMRYEWEPGPHEVNNGTIVGFNRNAINPIQADVTGIVAKGVLEYAGLNGNPTTMLNPTKTKFGPRLGFAYTPDQKTTLRGGWGLFYAPIRFTGYTTPGYIQYTPLIGTINGGQTPNVTLDNPFPNGLLHPVGNAAGDSVGVGTSPSFIDQYSRSPLVHQFSVDVQRVLPYQIVVTAGYVGSRAQHMSIGTGSININQIPASQWSSALFNQVPNPFYGNGGTGVIGSPTVTQAQLLQPYPEFGSVSLMMSDFNHTKYDSMVLTANKRLSNGLTYFVSYTWAKGTGAYGSPQDAYNLAAEEGLTTFDVTDRITSNFTYDLPFGKGRHWSTKNSVLDALAGGWQVNGLGFWQTGYPLSITQPNSNAITGASVQRPNATGVSPASTLSGNNRIDGWINPAAFSRAPQFTLGNLSATIPYRAPREEMWDLSLFKSYSIKERFTAQFRFEALNALNEPIFSSPNTTFGTGSFGTITSVNNQPRLLQVGLRFMY